MCTGAAVVQPAFTQHHLHPPDVSVSNPDAGLGGPQAFSEHLRDRIAADWLPPGSVPWATVLGRHAGPPTRGSRRSAFTISKALTTSHRGAPVFIPRWEGRKEQNRLPSGTRRGLCGALGNADSLPASSTLISKGSSLRGHGAGNSIQPLVMEHDGR